jgi:hypothetical protein
MHMQDSLCSVERNLTFVYNYCHRKERLLRIYRFVCTLQLLRHASPHPISNSASASADLARLNTPRFAYRAIIRFAATSTDHAVTAAKSALLLAHASTGLTAV